MTTTFENRKYAINHRVISRILLSLFVIIRRYGCTQKPTPVFIHGHRVSKVNASDSCSSVGVNLKNSQSSEMQKIVILSQISDAKFVNGSFWP